MPMVTTNTHYVNDFCSDWLTFLYSLPSNHLPYRYYIYTPINSWWHFVYMCKCNCEFISHNLEFVSSNCEFIFSKLFWIFLWILRLHLAILTFFPLYFWHVHDQVRWLKIQEMTRCKLKILRKKVRIARYKPRILRKKVRIARYKPRILRKKSQNWEIWMELWGKKTELRDRNSQLWNKKNKKQMWDINSRDINFFVRKKIYCKI